MEFNNAAERRKFEAEWMELRKEYAAVGMSGESIEEMYLFDLSQFNSERTFKEHSFFLEELNEDCSEGEEYSDLLLQSYLDQFTTPYDALGEHARYWWLEELRDPRLVKGLAKLTDEDKELLTLIFVQQYTQKECAVKLHSSQSAISRRIARIIDVFTKK